MQISQCRHARILIFLISVAPAFAVEKIHLKALRSLQTEGRESLAPLSITRVETPAQSLGADEQSLRKALLEGGTITFSNGGTILLTSSLEVRTNVVIDGRNQTVRLDGAGTNRIFHVFQGAELELTNIVLQHGDDFAVNDAGLDLMTEMDKLNSITRPAAGGAVFNEGTLRMGNSFIENCGAHGRNSVWTGPPMAPTNAFQSARGGAIYNSGGLVVLDGVVITNCAAIASGDFGFNNEALGGAIYNLNGSLELTDVRLVNNIASQRTYFSPISGSPSARARVAGGAIYSRNGTNRLARCYFDGNQVLNPADDTESTFNAGGGAILNENGTAIADDCAFANNRVLGPHTQSGSAHAGGGALWNSGELELRNSAFVRNSAPSGKMDLGQNYGVSQNAALGGALFNTGGAGTMNCTFYANEATGGTAMNDIWPEANLGSGPALGAAVYNEGVLAVTNCTFSRNRLTSRDSWGVPPSDGTPYFKAGRKAGFSVFNTNQVTVQNSIFAADAGETNIVGMVIDSGHNLSTDTAPIWTQGSSKNNSDPRLGALGYYSGATPVLPLLAGSPAIDAGETLTEITQDQRGRARPFGLSSDIGAFESSPPYAIAGSIQSQWSLPGLNIAINGVVHDLSGSNDFEFEGFDTGAHIAVVPSARETVFSPLEQQVDLQRDVLLNPFVAYALNTFTFERSGPDMQITFAGESNKVYRVEGSTNLSDWSDLFEGALPSQIFRIPANLLTNQYQFFRVAPAP